MSSKKILVVFGATGKQGGSVIQSILGDPATASQFEIHAVTRDASKPAAKVLADKGVILVKADLDDKVSLRLALKDAYAVFAVTNFFESFSKEREIQQGKNVADVAKELNVQHLIWSTLPNVTKITNGKLTRVFHFDGKAIVEEYIRSLNIPATFLLLSIYHDFPNSLLHPHPTAPKTFKISIPNPMTLKFPLISVKEDTGKYVKAILLNMEELLGKQVYAGEKEYEIGEIIEIMKSEGSLDVVFEQCSDEEFRAGLATAGLPEFMQQDMSDNMKYIAEYGFANGEGLEAGHEILTEPLETYAEWVRGGGLAEFK